MSKDDRDIMSGELSTPRDEKGRTASHHWYGETNHPRHPFYGEINHHRDSLYYGDRNHQNFDDINHQFSNSDRNHQNFDKRNRHSFYGDVNHHTFDERHNPSPLGDINRPSYFERIQNVGKMGENNSPKYLTPTDIRGQNNNILEKGEKNHLSPYPHSDERNR